MQCRGEVRVDIKSLPLGLWLFCAPGIVLSLPQTSSRNNLWVIPAYLCSFLQVDLEEYEMAASAYFPS